MTIRSRTLVLTIAALLAASGPSLAADPAGSTPTTRPPVEPQGQALPTPGRTPGPTGLTLRPMAPPQPPDDLAANDAQLDALIGVLGATSFGAPPGACTGLIPCCNTDQDADCEFVSYDIACVAAGGYIQIDELPDGSTQYSCPAP